MTQYEQGIQRPLIQPSVVFQRVRKIPCGYPHVAQVRGLVHTLLCS